MATCKLKRVQTYKDATCFKTYNHTASASCTAKLEQSLLFRYFERKEKRTLLWLVMIHTEHALALLSDKTTYAVDHIWYATL